MSTTPQSSLLKSFSEISSHTRCDNCHINLDQVRWKQCSVCRNFDLCHTCAEPGVKLEDHTLDYHKTEHTKIKPSDPEYNELLQSDPEYEKRLHSDPQDPNNMRYVWVEDVEKFWHNRLSEMKQERVQDVIKKREIKNDYEMSDVMARLLEMKRQEKQLSDSEENDRSVLSQALVDYHIQASEREIRVLSLDGGGVRGYMSVKVLSQLIKDTYNPLEDKEPQKQFTDRFDYFAGTSTGGLIAFCLATDYPLSKIEKIYAHPEECFVRNRFTTWWSLKVGCITSAHYNHEKIHDKIHSIINEIFNDKSAAETATLLDLHNLLNPHQKIDKDKIEENRQHHGNLLEFVDEPHKETEQSFHHVKREKVLLINAYNTTKSRITVFNTSYSEHWQYRIADVLKATMAAPTYFQPWEMYKGTIKKGSFEKDTNTREVFIDGGVFANDPELTALWAIRMQWKKMANYRFLSIGTGCYSSELPKDSWGGLYTWFGKVLVTDALMDATRSLTETVMNNLAKFDNVKRMKFNYKLTQSMGLDDLEFPEKFDHEWDVSKDKLRGELKDESKGESSDRSRYGLRYGPDYKALVYFHETYIKHVKE